MKKALIIIAALIVPVCVCAYPPKPTNTKGLKINCAKAKKEAREKTKDRKRNEWPPTSP